MNQEVVKSHTSDSEMAVNELCSRLKKNLSAYNAIIFFASSSYDFKKISELLYERFPNAQVVGTTTSGEISRDGFEKNTIILNALSDGTSGRSQFKGVLIDNIDKFPMIHKKDIENAASSIGIQLSSSNCSRDAFAISLICGLLSAEEGMLSLLYSIIKDPRFLIAGGSAGDDLKFKSTAVSYNGKISEKGAVFLFVKTSSVFKIYKENIFQRSGKNVMLTGVNPETHTVSTIDGQNPKRRYAQILGIPESQVSDATLEHPFGRVFGSEIFIASLVNFDDSGKLITYARVLQDSVQEILNPMDTLSITEDTCKKIISDIPNPGCIILFNCILRTIGFQKKRQQESVNSIWKKYFPVYSGFSTYGEQFCHINSNQTLVVLVVGE